MSESTSSSQGTSSGSSSGQSQSTSGSFIPSYPQSGFLMEIAGIASQMGQQLYQWAQGEYAKNSQLTDQVVHNYLSNTDAALGMAKHDLGRYQDLFQPTENQLLKDAREYASPTRQADEMGRAESFAGQGMEAGRQNAIRDLEAYGLDPSALKHQSLDQAARLQTAATQVGAGQQARLSTEATGRALRSEAIQVGERYPGQVVNALNTAMTGLAGAENAQLANAATGAAVLKIPNDYLQTATGLKYPPLGNNQQSTSQQGSQQGSQNSSRSQKETPEREPRQQGQQQPRQPGQQPGQPGGNDSGGGPSRGTPANTGEYGKTYSPQTSFDPTKNVADMNTDSWNPQPFLPGYDSNTPSTYNLDQFTTGSPSSGVLDYGQNTDYFTSNAPSSGVLDQPNPDSWFNSTQQGGQSYDESGMINAYSPPTQDQQSYDSGYSYSSGESDYAEGGAIPDADDPTTGGFVPPDASPSMGAQVDDVNANLNAGEFVIPKDVAAWKGQEFFQKLIEQSRKARVTAPAHGKPGPTQPGAPTFASQNMGQQ